MATAPQIKTRDGLSTAQFLVFTTNQETVLLEGTVDPNTVDLQVSINGGGFVSDSTLVALNGQSFTVPNVLSYPDGLPLDLGENTIELRAIDIVGGVSATSSATVTRVSVTEGIGTLIPTGIRLRRRRGLVDLLAAVPTDLSPQGGGSSASDFQFRGFNYYASRDPGGTSGYFKINASPVTEVSSIFEEDLLDITSKQVVFDPLGSIRVKVTQLDELGREIEVVSDTTTDVLQFSGTLKFSSTLQSRALTEFVAFRHNRAGGAGIINSDQFVDIDDSESLYYVITGVFFDPTSNSEFETPYSQEVVGKPLVIDTTIRDLESRTQRSIVVDFLSAIQRVNQEISLIPGSTTRDVSIDPFASEAERIWFIVDFVHRSNSFLTLLQIDDANGDGVTDPAVSSPYKQALKAALGLSSDTAVQQLIDSQFDKLAGNFGKPRLPGRPSTGQVVFYTSTRPTQDITIASGTIVSSEADTDAGIPSVRYVVGGTFNLLAANADAAFNFSTQRYEIVADIVAETIGSAGNRPAGAINSVQSAVGGLQVVNVEATVFGNNRESNSDLATRAELGFVSVDTGTEGGYAATSAAQKGVLKTKIVKSGDSLMMRDYDDLRKKHAGGKVDIWVQGLRERTVTERFAFTFEVARDIRVQILDLANLIFRVQDSRVTPDSPIVEILDNSGSGLGVRNVSTAQDYDLTGVQILDYQTFQLNTAIVQPVTNIDDIVTADYRFRAVNQFSFTLQPVRRVTSVVGEASGALDNALGYDLYKIGDPLLVGESTISTDYLIINQVAGIPTGAIISVNDETHVMLGFNEERLNSIGVNTATLRVFSADRLTEYAGPAASVPDFEVVAGTATTPVRIVRTVGSTIVNGQTVSVDYDHDENFTVTYVINDLLQQLQQTVNKQRHITADVLVKQAVLNSVALETTVQLKRGATKDKVDPAVRSSVSVELDQKLIGQGTAQSDVINAIDSTDGVDFQALPLARMGYADGSRKLREPLLSTNLRVSSLDIGGNQAYLLTNALQFPTTDGGGLKTEHKGVFQDDEALIMALTLATVCQGPNQAYILGASGAIIANYSDTATLIADGFTEVAEIAAERIRRTANHIVISLSGAGIPPDAPDNHKYTTSYVIRGDIGPHDITASQVESLDLGGFSLTFRDGV